jgi:outer membrane protein assembly factor BamD
MMKKQRILIALLGLAIFGGACSIASAQVKLPKKKQAAKTTDNKDATSSAEPDKILFDRANEDIKHGRYTEGRLALQTLINTYPDSEYLAKAKLAVADSYYKEGGTSNLTQSVAEYKDFITFFPFLEEAAYAQMQVGMAHFKLMEKADRDSSQAQMAEDEFQAMLLKFPQSPLAPQAEQRLREVQEVLADGEYKIAHYYYTKQDYRASAARLLEVTNRYPLYSRTDEALWMLGDIYTRVKLGSKNEDVRNYWAALSGKVYDRIVQEYPLSPRAPDAKGRLKQMGMPVPAADPEALARMQKERDYERQHHSNAALRAPMGMLHGNPDVSVAAHVGQPNLTPPDDAVSASEVLKPNAAGSGFTLSGTATGGGESTTVTDSSPTTQEDANTSTGTSSGTGGASGNEIGGHIIEPESTRPPVATTDPGAPNANPPTSPVQPAANQPDTKGAGDSSGANSSSNSASGAASAGSSTPATQTGTDARPASTGQAAQTAADGTSSSTSSSSQTAAQTSTDDSKDSTSKKKKGVKKLIPW